jgi:hypothetical protein
LRLKRGLRKHEKRKLSDVLAVQLCPRRPVSSSVRPYELNLVMADPPGERETFHCWRSPADEAKAAAQRLAGFLDLPLLDHTGEESTLTEVPLADGSTVEISRRGAFSDLFVMGDRPLHPTDGGTVLRGGRANPDRIVGHAVLLLVCLGCSQVPLALDPGEPGEAWFPLVMFWVLAVAAGACAWVVISALRCPLADRLNGMLRLPRGMWGWDARPLAAIGAVQVCRGKLKWRKREYWELNLVMHEPPAERVTFHTRGTAEAARADAQTLADFLGVPLVDHSEPEGPEATIGPEAAGGERDGRA